MTDVADKEVDLSPLTGYLGYQIRQAQAASFRDLAGSMRGLGVTPGEFGLMTIVHANPGLRQNDLVAIYRLDKSTLSVAVTGLVRRGLLRQEKDPEDRRRHALHLTAAGETALAAATRLVEDQERRMETILADGEREAMIDALRRIVGALEAG